MHSHTHQFKYNTYLIHVTVIVTKYPLLNDNLSTCFCELWCTDA